METTGLVCPVTSLEPMAWGVPVWRPCPDQATSPRAAVPQGRGAGHGVASLRGSTGSRREASSRQPQLGEGQVQVPGAGLHLVEAGWWGMGPQVSVPAPRLDILHQVAVWQRNFKRIVSDSVTGGQGRRASRAGHIPAQASFPPCLWPSCQLGGQAPTSTEHTVWGRGVSQQLAHPLFCDPGQGCPKERGSPDGGGGQPLPHPARFPHTNPVSLSPACVTAQSLPTVLSAPPVPAPLRHEPAPAPTPGPPHPQGPRRVGEPDPQHLLPVPTELCQDQD